MAATAAGRLLVLRLYFILMHLLIHSNSMQYGGGLKCICLCIVTVCNMVGDDERYGGGLKCIYLCIVTVHNMAEDDEHVGNWTI